MLLTLFIAGFSIKLNPNSGLTGHIDHSTFDLLVGWHVNVTIRRFSTKFRSHRKGCFVLLLPANYCFIPEISVTMGDSNGIVTI